MNKHYNVLVILLMLTAVPGKAQFLKRVHARPNEQPPKAILVELPTETNRIAYFTKKGQLNKVKVLQDANYKVSHVMVDDFRDNFSFCPVYFFYDSCTEQVRGMQFQGVLLDDKLAPAKNIILNNSDTNYFIVYYGTETMEELPAGAKVDIYNTSNTGSTMSNLFALSYDFKKLRYGLPDKPRGNSFSKNTYIPKYSYESGEFAISYIPLANRYSLTLAKYYSPRKHKKA